MWLLVKPNKDCYDYTQFGDNTERVYESLVCGKGVSDVKFSAFCVDNVSSISYSEFCYNASHMFGCSYMQRGNSYCVLNKQYTKEEYEAIVPKIIQHMKDMPYKDKQGRVYAYGEYTPRSSPCFVITKRKPKNFSRLIKKKR
jgi:hypothetical protein